MSITSKTENRLFNNNKGRVVWLGKDLRTRFKDDILLYLTKLLLFYDNFYKDLNLIMTS